MSVSTLVTGRSSLLRLVLFSRAIRLAAGVTTVVASVSPALGGDLIQVSRASLPSSFRERLERCRQSTDGAGCFERVAQSFHERAMHDWANFWRLVPSSLRERFSKQCFGEDAEYRQLIPPGIG